ncbi:LamG-like jellyroll fold domain-containing protein, partial [Saccharicrinis sp. FJH62]|uniref:LamG-like jellyroll fold domain-containing protein n=1 Tax=Saccharicrinis sp. FJH62 TaxID=3344657 RepID=UPI0035D4EA86
MRRLNTFLLVLGLFVLTGMSAQNLLLNGDFESWDDVNTPTSWPKAENVSQEADADSIHGGTYSAKQLGGTNDLGQGISDIIPGRSYKITMWYQVTDGDGTDARIWSYWLSNGSNLTDNADELRGPNNSYFDNNGGVWSSYSTTVVAPATADSFYFEVRTYSGAVVNYDDFSFELLSASAPVIADVTVDPVSVTSSDDVTVSATVTDDGTVANVGLVWGLTSGSTDNQVVMSNGGSGDVYTGTIPAQADGATVYFTVGAMDNDSETSSSAEMTYVVRDPSMAALPYTQTFDADLGDFYAYSVSGDTKDWYYASGYAAANGFNSGDEEIDYLISPAFDLTGTMDEVISFKTWRKYGVDDDADNYLKLYYSTDYAGLGDPSTATWTEVSGTTFPTTAEAETWTKSEDVDVSMAEGDNVHFAFVYKYQAGNYVQWEVDSVVIKEKGVLNDEAAAVNWVFDLGTADQKATYTDSTLWDPEEVTVGSNFSYNGTEGWRGTNGEYVLPTFTRVASASKSYDNPSADNMVSFVINPKADLTFKPTNISFDCARFGTDGGKFNLYWLSPDGTQTAFGPVDFQGNRSTKVDDYTHIDIDVSGLNFPAGMGSCALQINITELDAGKSVGFANIQIDGLLSGKLFVPSAVLMHSYTFDVADTVIDVVGDVDGMINGTPTIEDGVFISATNGDFISFDGAALALNTYSAITTEAYVRAGAGTNPSWTVFAYFGGNAGANAYLLTIARDDNVSRTEYVGGGIVNGPELEDGKLHHLVSILGPDTISYYIDGDLVGKVQNTKSISDMSTENAWLCKGGWPDATWNGSIYEYNIYEGELDPQTISDNAYAFLSPSDARLAELSSADGELIPTYDSFRSTYVLSVAEGTTNVNIAAVPMTAGATVTGAGDVTIEGAVDTIEIKVVSVDKTDSMIYTVYTMVLNPDCYTPLYPSLENLVQDPELTDINLWGGWGARSIYYGPEAYCGASCALLEAPDKGCKAALDIANFKWKPNTTYQLHVMVKTIDGSIGFLASSADPNFGFSVDTKGEWMLVDTTFTTGPNAGTNFYSFNTCDFGSNCTAAYIDNYELYELPPYTLALVTKSTSAYDVAVADSIIAQGDYLVTTYIPDGGDGVITMDDATALSDYDVVIIGRNIGSDKVGAAKDAWDEVTAPVLCMNMYGIRSNSGRAFWTPTQVANNITANADTVLKAQIVKPTDAVFDGITETTIDYWNGMFSIFAPDTEGDDAGNGELLMTSTINEPLFIRWEKNVEFYPGAGHSPKGDRTYLGNGNDNTEVVYFGFTEVGKTIFFNELERMASGEPVVIPRVKKVAYVQKSGKTVVATAADPYNDPIVEMLNADDNFEVTVIQLGADDTTDLGGYDVVLAQETFGSGDAVWKPGKVLGLASIEVPFVYNKVYALKDGKAFSGGATGGVAEVADSPYLVVDP